MRWELKEFQERAVDQLEERIRSVSSVAAKEPQTVVLSAPTGAGKTVMLTALIERLLFGSDEYEPDPDATFLWLSDLPRINAQSRERITKASDKLDDFDLVDVDSSFNGKTFEPGKVFFLNTQKLGRDKKLVTHGDGRSHTIWETINNTAAERPESFYVIIDEAHRGMQQSTRDTNRAETAVQKFLLGNSVLNAVPLVVGVSATPDRFSKLIDGRRTVSPRVEVPAVDVRESGLLKEQIVLKFSADETVNEFTLLAEAARSWEAYVTEWQAYCDAEDEALVVPKLIVQVLDAPGGKAKEVTRTDLGECIDTINRALSKPLKSWEFAHSFDVEGPIDIGARTLIHVHPERIADNDSVKVVFFKMALSTGWDCPAAEVMMSFRPAKDATYIAQLIGRMVRTPLARRITSNEQLNGVDLFLPRYDKSSVESIIAKLTEGDYEYKPPVDITTHAVTLRPAPGSEDAVAAWAELPSYLVPRRHKPKHVWRLMRLAGQLARDEILDDPVKAATTRCLDVLDTELAKAKADPDFAESVQGKAIVEIGQKTFGMLQLATLTDTTTSVAALDRDIQAVFAQSGRRIGEGLHEAFWRSLVNKGVPKGFEEEHEREERLRVAKSQTVVLLSDQDVLDAIEAAARDLVTDWLTNYKADIAKLSEGKRVKYKMVEGAVQHPTETTNPLPKSIVTKKLEGAQRRNKHLFVDADGAFHEEGKYTSLESTVLDHYLADPSVKFWLRNYDRKDWAIRIPWHKAVETRAMYPDFAVFRDVNGKTAVDLLDPHTTSQDDAIGKALGLCEFAKAHGTSFGRIHLIDEIDGVVRALDLKAAKVQDKLFTYNTNDQLQQLYRDEGKPIS